MQNKKSRMNIEPPAGYRIHDPIKEHPKSNDDLCWDSIYNKWTPVLPDGRFKISVTYARKITKPEWPKAITDIEGLPEDGCVLAWDGEIWCATYVRSVRNNYTACFTHWMPQPPAPVPPVKSADELEIEAVDAVSDYGCVQTPDQCLKIFRAGRAFDRSQEKKA